MFLVSGEVNNNRLSQSGMGHFRLSQCKSFGRLDELMHKFSSKRKKKTLFRVINLWSSAHNGTQIICFFVSQFV